MKQLLPLLAFLFSLGASAQSGLKKTLDSLTKAYETNGFHGVILVAKGDQVLFEKGYGLANFDKKIAHTPSTLFKTESVGKMFTAVAVLQLVEAGKLKLTQTVGEILPDLQIKNADKITIHHLLTHTSGLQSPWDHPDWKFKKNHSKEELKKIVEAVPLSFETPGQRMFYSNSGFVVLGWVIEKVAGKSFDTYLQEAIFNKLQMKNTRHLNDTLMPLQNGAQPYRILSSKRHILLDETVGPKASAAGGWISTSHDLYRFMLGLYSNKLLKPETWAMMRSADGHAPKENAFRYYAYGMETYVNQLIPGANLYGHNGGGAGFSVDAFVDPETGFIVTSCTNLYQNSRPIAVNYLKAAMGKKVDPIQPMDWVQVYDAIEGKGADVFFANGKEALQALHLEPHPGLFAQVADAFEAAKDYELQRMWLDFAATLYPEEVYLLILRGDNQVKLGNREKARALYQTAKDLGEKNKVQWMVNAIDDKLKKL
jgi:CubicO group peptidase (beta-lactamase class C family)